MESFPARSCHIALSTLHEPAENPKFDIHSPIYPRLASWVQLWDHLSSLLAFRTSLETFTSYMALQHRSRSHGLSGGRLHSHELLPVIGPHPRPFIPSSLKLIPGYTESRKPFHSRGTCQPPNFVKNRMWSSRISFEGTCCHYGLGSQCSWGNNRQE